MMDNNDQRLAMSDINGESVLMSNIELLPNIPTMSQMSNIMDEQFMQLLGTQTYLMTDGSHLGDNQRNSMNSVNSGHNSPHPLPPMDRHSVESCNYVSNQYEPQYHDSSDSHRYKYRSSGMSTVAETVTHVSETDSNHSIGGQNSFGNVVTSVANLPVQQNYSNVNNWSQIPNHTNITAQHQSRAPMSAVHQQSHSNSAKVTPHSAYIPRQRISNFVPNVTTIINPSTTSTPVNQGMNNNLILHNNNHNNINVNKNHTKLMSEGLVQMHPRLDSPTVQKRTLIIFKVVDQIVDNSGKVLKETIIKNEEIVRNLGKCVWNESTSTTSPISTIGNVSRNASHTGSGVLADVSSSVRSASSLSVERQNNQNNESLTKSHSIDNNDELYNKSFTPIPPLPPIPVVDINYIKPENSLIQNLEIRTSMPNEMNDAMVVNIGQTLAKVVEPKISERRDGKDDEEERRETATALLSLTQRSLNIDCNTGDQQLSHLFTIRAGNRVMAKWRDKNFYPALISKHLPQNNKWSVIFEDRATKTLFDTELIELKYLSEGQDVMVTISEGFCAKAVIKAVVVENNDLFFEVEHLKDDKTVVKRYPLKDIFLNAEQSASIATKSVKPALNGAVFGEVDLDNIVIGKRARVTAKTVSTEEPIVKPVQQFKNGRRRPIDAVSVDVEEDIAVEDEQTFGVKPKKKANNLRMNKRKVESHNALFNNEHSLSISPRTTKVHTALPAHELIKLLGPLPDEGSRIFERVCFLLTCGDRNKGDEVLSLEQSNPERSTPYDKLYLIKQIQTGGGIVFESFEDMKNAEDNTDQVLIADTYHRSIKYIQCLAAGVSIASHLWVIDCCRQNKYLKRDNYTLPAGFSIITNALPSDKNTFKKSSTLFKGTKFYFGSKTPETLQTLWAPVLSAAQAVIVENNSITVQTLSRKTVDIIIGDTTCALDLVKRAKQMKIAVISSEYIVQCLINGRKLSYDASPLFSYTKSNNL